MQRRNEMANPHIMINMHVYTIKVIILSDFDEKKNLQRKINDIGMLTDMQI